MATPAQIEANRLNSEKSTGATSEAGRLASSRNNLQHGLCGTELFFALLPGEDPENFAHLTLSLRHQYEPQNATEIILVRRMAEAEWMRARAVGFQTDCFVSDPDNLKKIALFIRYQTTHERSFYKALNELQKLREQTRKAEIGFESQSLKQAAETRSVEALNLKKDVHNLKKEEFEFKKTAFQVKNERFETPAEPEISPSGLEIAA
jgi:hypothetical protein